MVKRPIAHAKVRCAGSGASDSDSCCDEAGALDMCVLHNGV
jgi:hypothetical protein